MFGSLTVEIFAPDSSGVEPALAKRVVHRLFASLVCSSVLGLSLALSLLAASPAADLSSDDVPYPRPARRTPTVTEDALARRLAQAHRAQARQAERPFEAPGRRFRKCRSCTSAEIRAEQIAFLTELLAELDADHPDVPDLLFRLADHHREAKAEHELQAALARERLDALDETP